MLKLERRLKHQKKKVLQALPTNKPTNQTKEYITSYLKLVLMLMKASYYSPQKPNFIKYFVLNIPKFPSVGSFQHQYQVKWMARYLYELVHFQIYKFKVKRKDATSFVQRRVYHKMLFENL